MHCMLHTTFHLYCPTALSTCSTPTHPTCPTYSQPVKCLLSSLQICCKREETWLSHRFALMVLMCRIIVSLTCMCAHVCDVHVHVCVHVHGCVYVDVCVMPDNVCDVFPMQLSTLLKFSTCICIWREGSICTVIEYFSSIWPQLWIIRGSFASSRSRMNCLKSLPQVDRWMRHCTLPLQLWRGKMNSIIKWCKVINCS